MAAPQQQSGSREMSVGRTGAKCLSHRTLILGALVALLVTLSTGCARQPAPASYKRDVAPLLAEHCGRCHLAGGKGTQTSGLAMDSYEQLMEGTRFGPVIRSGEATGSTLIAVIEGRVDPKIRMPLDGHNPLGPDEIRIIKRWIDEGARNN